MRVEPAVCGERAFKTIGVKQVVIAVREKAVRTYSNVVRWCFDDSTTAILNLIGRSQRSIQEGPLWGQQASWCVELKVRCI